MTNTNDKEIAKKPISAKLTKEQNNRVKKLANMMDVSVSEMMRRLIKAGLEEMND